MKYLCPIHCGYTQFFISPLAYHAPRRVVLLCLLFSQWKEIMLFSDLRLTQKIFVSM